MSVSMGDAGTRTGASERRLSVALGVGAALWLVLLTVGFFAPGGWAWGMAGPIGHIENYMITLWLVTLVLAPLIAMRSPLKHTATIEVYLLGVLGVVLSAFRAEALLLIADGPPLVAAALSIGLVVWSHPQRRILFRLR